jgi:hypothetical protein
MENLMNLTWGSFTPVHLCSLVFAVLIPIGIHFLLRHRGERVQILVLFILSLLGPVSLAYDLIVWGIPSTPLQYLPLHMCSYNALLTPVLVLTRNRFLGNLLPLFSVGAAIALVFNSIQAEYAIFSTVFFLYYFSHTFGASIPFLMFSLGHTKAHPRYILPSTAATLGIYTLSHFANLAVNHYLASVNFLDWAGDLIQVNYMFSIHPQGNPLLLLFWSVIPYPYFYMLLAIPIAAAYFVLMNLPYILKHAKEKGCKRRSGMV